jgi:glycosyltransferase involved in cell wall biosynthesis
VLDTAEAAAAFGVRYLGAVSNTELAELRAAYAFSFVAWAPTQFNTLYACPNKLFESIASGVPPIAAPHPQCAAVLREHDCGILMRNWSFDAFCEALDTAQGLLGTPRYRQLVRNCLHAHRTALNWERQFAEVAGLLPASRALGAANRPVALEAVG